MVHSERYIDTHGILPHGGITHIGGHLGVKTWETGDGEKIIDARVDFQILHEEFLGDFPRHGVTELHVLAPEICRIMHEGVACYVVLAVGAVTENGIDGFVRIVGRPGVVGDILYKRLAHDGDKAECLIVVVHLMVAYPPETAC